MSLIKQLWLAILGVVLISLGGSLFISMVTSTQYFEQELRIKNADNANALALSLSQLDKDPVVVELLIAAQFDTGHYRRIELVTPDGNTLLRRVNDASVTDVPEWFVNWVDFSIPSGQAVIQNGWQQYATIIVESHYGYAYRLLWQGMIDLMSWFAIATLISAALAWWIVGTIKRPLRAVIAQARGIGQHNFSVCEEQPRTRELREVVTAMNQLSMTMSTLFSQESKTLDHLRRQLQQDEITGVIKRDIFVKRIDTLLSDDSDAATGHIVLARLLDLTELNKRLGYKATNQLLVHFADMLGNITSHYENGQVGRLNGSDFAILLPGCEDAQELRQRLETELHTQLEEAKIDILLPVSLIQYGRGDDRRELFSALDGALAAAETRGGNSIEVVNRDNHLQFYNTHKEWRHALIQAKRLDGIRLGRNPVLDQLSRLMHYEAPARLKLEGEWQTGGVFLPWLSRVGLSCDFDLSIVDAALETIVQKGKPLSIGLSRDAIFDSRFTAILRQYLKSRPEEAKQLWIEVPESIAVRYMDILRPLALELRSFGCRIGLERAGPEFAKLPELQNLGLSYIKIDTWLVRDIHLQQHTHPFLTGIVTLCHSIGMEVIGQGVVCDAERDCLFALGFDGVTGPGVRHHLDLVRD
ncbi:LapD/MoxY N-terminal periplasmic domain-containing protein [Halomonas sp. PR-M31]|uniref:bifunctional diguanylate cyclase/phosphodiesterase n=1 Tax=Halomonas sp. PR-M31 TaxID=1471202 RepID=UPI000650FE63|nr:LapD/MoxY N-terminal periplasmic domain-containing protein [Halomonas sp. PR-M31]